MEDHINSKKHKQNAELKKARLQQLVTKTSAHAESSFNYEFVETCIGAELHFLRTRKQKIDKTLGTELASYSNSGSSASHFLPRSLKLYLRF